MSSLSNPTSRVLEILNFLAANPTEAFTQAEIARHLDLSGASAYRILKTMTSAQYLSCHPKHKTYSLGMAPVAIGDAALAQHRGIEIARREIMRLAMELNVQCTISAMVDDDVLLLAKEGTPQSHGGVQRVGERTPVIPPIGMEFMAWSSEEDIGNYLDKAAPYLDKSMQEHLKTALATIRRRGYSISAAGPAKRKLRKTVIQPIGKPRDEAYWRAVHALIGELTAEDIQLIDPHQAEGNDISHLSAPVFSANGSVAFILIATGMPLNIGVKKIEEYAERLRTAATVVTSEIYGKAP